MIAHLPSSISTADVVTALERDGVVVVDGLVDPSVMDRARAELAPWLETTRFGPGRFYGQRTRRTGALVARSAVCRELVMHPLALDVTRDLLKDPSGFQLHLTQVIAIGPGEPGQTIHRDQWGFGLFPFPVGYEVQCNTIWAMTDFTEENGATRIAVGSNRFADRLQMAEADTEPATMTKGSVLFYTGSVYHGGGANRSDATRYGINITYNRSWLRQEENQYLAVPQDVARTLPLELLRIMGYARAGYGLGYVDDLRDPIAVLHPEMHDPNSDPLAAVANARGDDGRTR